jgi:uncharacterized protein YkwD
MARARSLLLALALTLAVSLTFLATPAAGNRAAAAKQHALDRQLLAQLNVLRARHGLRPLHASGRLGAAATRHSFEMAERGYFAHSSADGTAFWKRVRYFYPAAGFRRWSVGENLVWQSPQLTATGAIRAWMASPPHRANLLNPAWSEIGISAVASNAGPGVYRGLKVVVVTADFGARARSRQ